MENTLVVGFLFLSLALTGASSNLIDGSALASELTKVANDGLGVQAMQVEYDKLNYYERNVDGPGLVQEISQSLSAKFDGPIQAIKAIKSKVEAEYSNFQSSNTFTECCQATGLEFEIGFKTEISLHDACITISSQSPTNAKYPTRAIIDVMKNNHKANPTLKWQYFGSEDGHLLNYPTLKLSNCRNYDPRIRPFYVATATPKAKDVVIVIDTSGSMSKEHNSRTLMTIAKEAAKSVIQTLNPNDRVGVVAFSSDARTPPGDSDTSSCYSNTLAAATPFNTKYLQSYVNQLQDGGGTNYGRALAKAFSFFHNDNAVQNGTSRVSNQVILFLSDGIPNDHSGGTAYDAIRDENQKLGNRVVIMTFGLGEGLSTSAQYILGNMSAQIRNNETFGEIRRPQFQHVSNPDTLRSQMATFYDFFSPSEELTEAVFSVPYVDGFGIGLISSICLPVYAGKLIGVACADITVSDLLGDITYFQEGELSYAFIIDGTGRALMHPLLPRPYDTKEDSIFVNIENLERSAEAKEVIQSMMLGKSGSKTFSSSRTYSKGNVLREGINTAHVKSHYYWTPIPHSNFSICIVVGDNDKQAVLQTSLTTNDDVFTYHRLDLKPDDSMCKHYRRYATKGDTSVMLTPPAFINPFKYLDTKETVNSVNELEQYLRGKTSVNPGLTSTVRDAVVATYKAEAIWDRRESASYAVWRYIGTIDGVMRVSPGVQLPKNFDHTRRPWYQRTLANKGKNVLSAPYLDGWGSGYVITMSKVIYEGTIEGRSNGQHTTKDKVVAVMGTDFTLTYFYQLIRSKYDACNKQEYSCFVVDSSGYVVMHDTFVASTSLKPRIENVHIIELEPAIAEDLIKKGKMVKNACIEFVALKNQYYYTLSTSDVVKQIDGSPGYELHEVENSNVFVVIAKRTSSSINNCRCTDTLPSRLKCASTLASSCICPCHTKLDFLYCKDEFKLKSDAKPSCSPIAPTLIATIGAEVDKIGSLEDCLDPKCSTYNTQESCYGVAGCNWCLYNSEGHFLGTQYCGTQNQCYFGREGVSCPYDSCLLPDGTTDPTDDEGPNVGGIVGGVIGCLVALVIVVVIVCYCKKHRNTHTGTRANNAYYDNHAGQINVPATPSAPAYAPTGISNVSEPPPSYTDVRSDPIKYPRNY